MMVVSWELFKQLTSPGRKPGRKLQPEDVVAHDTFSGETMEVLSPEEFFGGKPQEKPRGKARGKTPGRRSGKNPGKWGGKNRRKLPPVSFEEFFSC